jgi:alpha/beta superfamily hydrolase
MKAAGLAMVVDCHGTIFSNNEAPSVAIENSASAKGAGVIFSSLAGFITLQPDYIGFGDSNDHYHPYLLKKSSANAVVDFTKAAIKFAKDNNIPMASNKGIYLTGYSQGGAVVLASLNKFQQEGMQVNIATPMDGPYLLDPIAQGVLSQDKLGVPSFMAAVAYSYTKAYNKDTKELIQEPYASKLPTLFNGSLTREEIDKQLTHKVKGDGGLFTDEIAQNYVGSWFQLRLKQNSVVDFTPTTHVELLHCLGDDVIPYGIAEGTKDVFENVLNAPSIGLTPVEIAITKNPNTELRLGHADCALPAYKVSAFLFSRARKQVLGY